MLTELARRPMHGVLLVGHLQRRQSDLKTGGRVTRVVGPGWLKKYLNDPPFLVKKDFQSFTQKFHSFIHSRHFYSAPSSPLLLRGAPDYSTDTVSEFHAEAHMQLQVKDLPKVPTWRLERESSP